MYYLHRNPDDGGGRDARRLGARIKISAVIALRKDRAQSLPAASLVQSSAVTPNVDPAMLCTHLHPQIRPAVDLT